MKIIINHLTRMEQGYICVAGIDVETRSHVRPVLQWGRLERGLLERCGGPFEMGAVVDLGQAWFCGERPAVEDWAFVPGDARRVGEISPLDFWRLLREVSRPRLKDIFGEDLHIQGRTGAVELGGGMASLGCLALSSRPKLVVDRLNKVRLELSDGEFSGSVSVADLRLYEEDHATPRLDLLEGVRDQIVGGIGVILSMGLTRPYTKPGESVGRYWLQVNNLHLEDNPLWKACGETTEQGKVEPTKVDAPIETITPDSVKPEISMDEIRQKPSKAYDRWTDAEEQELASKFKAGMSVPEIARALGRKPGAIRSRLLRSGLLPPSTENKPGPGSLSLDLKPFRDQWKPGDLHANFKAEVANYTVADPMPTLEELSRQTEIPVGCLVRYILVKWAASGSEALMAMGPVALDQMRHHISRAEEAGTEAARLEAYEALRQMIAWLTAGG